MIIDCHCHAGRGEDFWSEQGLSKWLLAYVRQAQMAGITRTALFPPLVDDYTRANRRVARIVHRHPDLFDAFAFVHAARDRGRVMNMLREFVLGEGFRGIKCHRYDAPISPEICLAARSLNVPVLYDPMGVMPDIDRCARGFPDVTFIIPHLGTFLDHWAVQREFIERLIRYPNVYTDTAGVRRYDLIQAAIDRAGAKKVLFGSDGPWMHAGVELAKIYALNLSPDQQRDVLGLNYCRITENSAAQRAAPAA